MAVIVIRLSACLFAAMLWVSQAHSGLLLSVDAILSSPAMTLGELESTWANPVKGNYAHGRARASSVFSLTPDVSFGLQVRFDHLLTFNYQTALFYSALENNRVLDGRYDLELSVNSASGQSGFIDYFIPLSSHVDINVRAHLISANRLQLGTLKGLGTVDGSQIHYQWYLDYAYDENRIFSEPRYDVRGWGHAFDMDLRAIYGNNTFKVQVEDIFHRLYWEGIEQDKGCLNRPLTISCNVQRKASSVTQTLPVHLSTSWSYQGSSGYNMGVEVQSWARYQALEIRAGADAFLAGYDLINETYHIGYESQYLKVKWGTDQLDIHEAKHWQLAFEINWPLYDI